MSSHSQSSHKHSPKQSPSLSSLRSNLRRVDLVNSPPPASRLHIPTAGSVNHLVDSPSSPTNERLKRDPTAALRPLPTPNMGDDRLSSNRTSPPSSQSRQPAVLVSRKPPSVRSVTSTTVSNHTRVTSTPSSPRLGSNTAATSITASSRSSLLIIITETFLPKLQPTIQSIMIHHPTVQEIQLCTTSDEMTKRLKMDCYTVIGKLSKDVAVTMLPSCEPDNISHLVSVLHAQGNGPLSGVLLCTQSEPTTESLPPQSHLLDLDIAEMQRRWQDSTLLIHAVARHTLPLLAPARPDPRPSTSNTATQSTKPFFFIHTDRQRTSLDPFHTAVRDLLLQSLAASPIAAESLIGYADDLVPPLPAPASAPRTPPRPILIPGQAAGGGGGGGYVPEPEETSQESPTKLYYLWSMQEQT